MAKVFKTGEIVMFQRETGTSIRWELGEYMGAASRGTTTRTGVLWGFVRLPARQWSCRTRNRCARHSRRQPKGNEMKLFWLDLETTGLDPAKCVVLEVAYAVASLERPFDPEVYGQMTVHHVRHEGDEVDPFVVDMHTKNGLWLECRGARFTMRDVEEHLLTIVPDIAEWEDKPTLAGNCVGFDHGFLKRYAPKLAARFHYRYYDVSSVKLFCRSLGMPKLPGGESHRAADDVQESIEHARRCADWARG